MDVTSARTFLAVVSSGSFIGAAERLNLTQTAISARIRQLEEELGRRLFIRNKAGARLTAAGERFLRHATALVQVWEGARQDVALPSGRNDVIRLGGELSLWNPLFADWLVWMHRKRPDIALRAEVDVPERLVERVLDGILDLAVLYSPQQRPNLVVELLAEEKLVMVTTDAAGEWHPNNYIHVDWGADFTASEQAAFPEIANPPVAISLGPLALRYLLAIGGIGYFRLGAVQNLIDKRKLYRIREAPEFSHSIYLVYSAQHAITALGSVREGFKACAEASLPHQAATA